MKGKNAALPKAIDKMKAKSETNSKQIHAGWRAVQIRKFYEFEYHCLSPLPDRCSFYTQRSHRSFGTRKFRREHQLSQGQNI